MIVNWKEYERERLWPNMRYFFLNFIFMHAPLLWSNTTCCNLHVSFVCRGCNDQHRGVSQRIPFTILKQYTNTVKAVQLQLEMCMYISSCYN